MVVLKQIDYGKHIIKAKQNISSQVFETNEIRKNILSRRNMVLSRYLRQIEYGKTYY